MHRQSAGECATRCMRWRGHGAGMGTGTGTQRVGGGGAARRRVCSLARACVCDEPGANSRTRSLGPGGCRGCGASRSPSRRSRIPPGRRRRQIVICCTTPPPPLLPSAPLWLLTSLLLYSPQLCSALFFSLLLSFSSLFRSLPLSSRLKSKRKRAAPRTRRGYGTQAGTT